MIREAEKNHSLLSKSWKSRKPGYTAQCLSLKAEEPGELMVLHPGLSLKAQELEVLMSKHRR